MPPHKVVASPEGGVTVPSTPEEEAYAAQRVADRLASEPERQQIAKDHKRRVVYERMGATMEDLTLALMDAEEGKPEALDKVKAARVAAKAEPDWPRD
jgi:hypothetical protein|tara:strand:- start:622 stop:915 length:294 start_codon:yes stop_codon:yes gene_type:complete